VDPTLELGGLFQGETGGEEGGIEQQPDQVLDGLAGLVFLLLVLKLVHDGVVGVEFHGFFGNHITGHGVVPELLLLHDPLHVSGPAELGGDENTGGFGDPGGNKDLLDLVAKDFLDELAQTLELLLLLIEFLLLILVIEVETLLGHGLKLLTIMLLHLLDAVLIDGVDHVQDLDAPLPQGLDEGGLLNLLDGLTGDVVDGLLALFHPVDVFLEGDKLVTGLGGLEPEEILKFLPVGGVLMDTELQVLTELLVELLVVIGLLLDLVEHLDALLNQVLLNDPEDLVLLKGLTGNVQRQILGIDNTLDEGQPFGDDFLAVIHDKHPPDVELDVVFLLLTLEHVERLPPGDEQELFELELTLDAKVLNLQLVLPIVGETLVEGLVVLGGDILGLPHPDGLSLV